MIVLDTSVLVHFSLDQRPWSDWVLAQVARGESLATSAICMAEFLEGAERHGPTRTRVDAALEMLDDLEVLPFDSASARRHASFQAWLATVGRPAPRTDALIAATALGVGGVIATADAPGFEAIPGVRLVGPGRASGPA